MIELMVSGHPDDPGHVRFGLYDAAAAVGYHRRAARALAQSPVFLEAYHSALAGDDIAHLCPTLEQVRAMMAKQNAARHLVQHKAGCIVRAPAKEGVAADGAA
ncbi:MAG TPA: hypothetical protein VKV77_11175 [Methylovirgula sp.]|nr:hypothetical protein [Methylovirgula sp.]